MYILAATISKNTEIFLKKVAKLVILGVSLLTSFLLALRIVLLAKLVISGILSSIFLILALYTSFLTTSIFLHRLFYLKNGTTYNLSTYNFSTSIFKLFKLVGTFFHLSISN